MFLNCSTCFGRHTAHHQELKNCNCSLWFCSFYEIYFAQSRGLRELCWFNILQFLKQRTWLVEKSVSRLRILDEICSSSRCQSHNNGTFKILYQSLYTLQKFLFKRSIKIYIKTAQHFHVFAPCILDMKISLLKSNWCTLCNYINVKIDQNYITHSDMFRSTQGPSSGSSLVLSWNYLYGFMCTSV